MALETATYVDSLNTANPADTDTRSSADDHARLLKASIKRTFPNIAGAVSASHGEMNFLQSASVAIQAQLDECKSFTGTVSYGRSAGYAQSANYAASAGAALYAASAGYAENAGEAGSAGETRIVSPYTLLAHAVTETASLVFGLSASCVFDVCFHYVTGSGLASGSVVISPSPVSQLWVKNLLSVTDACAALPENSVSDVPYFQLWAGPQLRLLVETSASSTLRLQRLVSNALVRITKLGER